MPGRWIRLSAMRRFTNDLLAVSRPIPSVPVQRVMYLAPLVEARNQLSRRPCWPAIFLKAYSLVSDRTPELRRAYTGLFRSRLYEFEKASASLAVERTIDGEAGVLFGKITDPAARSLREVNDRVRRYAEAPVEDVKSFRGVFRLAFLPGVARRSALRMALNIPQWRPKFFGTFGLTAYSSLGAESLHPISPLTTTLTYGVIDASGRVAVRIVYDHRALDGSTVARALQSLELVLNGEMRDEVLAMEPLRAAA